MLQNRGEAAKRAAKLREALALWRGAPLADLAFETFAQNEIRRLEELRLEAIEERIDADLELGEGSSLVSELEALVSQLPLRERLRAQLMLALYRSGRQAEALDVYHAGRGALSEQLGIDPGPELHQLYGRILRQESVLAPGSKGAYCTTADSTCLPCGASVLSWTLGIVISSAGAGEQWPYLE